MSKFIDIDDDRNCYIGNDGEYKRYNIDPEVLEEAEEIIYCRNCNHKRDYLLPFTDDKTWNYCTFHKINIKDTYFCSWVELKE